MSFKSFEELDCWKAAREVVQFVRTVIKKLPDSERYDLTDNMRRASRSATRNIAEGFGRFSFNENIKFCIIARGSLVEIIDDLITCKEENYITEEQYSEGRKLIDRALAVLNGYINYLERSNTNVKSKVNETAPEYTLNSPNTPINE